jgi:hypothetical protein
MGASLRLPEKYGEWRPSHSPKQHHECHSRIGNPFASQISLVIIDFHASGPTKATGRPAHREHTGDEQSLSTKRHGFLLHKSAEPTQAPTTNYIQTYKSFTAG